MGSSLVRNLEIILSVGSLIRMIDFNGEWETVSGRLGTASIPLPPTTFSIRGDAYTVQTPDGLDEGSITWGPEAVLREMDMIGTKGAHAGSKIEALVRVKGRVLQLCYAVDGGARPKDFNATSGTAVVTVRYRRIS
jgi:uncharacterized protein (TIGR03067 family)